MARPDEMGVNISAAAVTLTTTTEAAVIASGPVKAASRNQQVLIIAWAQLTLGAATTTVTPRIRRTALVGGALVGEANAINNGVPAGESESFFMMATEERQNIADVEYNFTLQQAAATGNGTVLQSGIVVMLF